MSQLRFVELPAFAVIGKEGATTLGPGFVERLWNDAERDLPAIAAAVRYNGAMPVYWGLMSDFSHSLAPWANDFKDGLYLAGFELLDPKLIPPEGWVKWEVPERRYLVFPIGDDYEGSFRDGLKALQENGYALSGAVFDHAERGVSVLLFPVIPLS
jgi:hypothetical protein